MECNCENTLLDSECQKFAFCTEFILCWKRRQLEAYIWRLHVSYVNVVILEYPVTYESLQLRNRELPPLPSVYDRLHRPTRR